MSFVSPRLVFFLAFVVFSALNFRLLSPAARSYFTDSGSTFQDVEHAGSVALSSPASANELNLAGDASKPYGIQVNDQHTPIVFALVMFGSDSAREGLLTLKTALMHVSRPTEFHIICSEDAIPVIEKKTALFSRCAL
jgi:uncharacterized protein (UPF0262 family)